MFKNLSSREKALLVVLVGALVWIVWWFGFRTGPDDGDGGATAEEIASRWAEPPVVRMDLLTAMAEDYDPAGRDLFKYSKRPPSRAELDARRVEQDRVQEARKKADEARLEARKRRPPTPPANTGPRLPKPGFKYIGHLGPKDDRLAVFVQGEEVFLARIGETVKDDFKVVKIDYQSVILGFTNPQFESRTQSLKMGG